MGIRSFLAKPFAYYVTHDIQKWSSKPVETQFRVLEYLLKNLSQTAYGKEKGISPATTYEEFRKRIPIQDYEAFLPYISRIKKGELNVLWPGRPLCFRY